MYLKTLKMENFRSFNKRTVEFKPGMTAIVGHNGAGKSNLLLAIDFVLSNKRVLRSKREMEVFVYSRMSRSKQRVLASYARVELVFEDSGNRMCENGATLKISRKIEFQGVVDELRVNGRKVSRNEVNTILQTLGFNSTNPCNYIRATRLDELLDSNGAKRKQQLEQIAGVSTFSAQKQKEAHKLLNNLTDSLLAVDAKIDTFDKEIGPIMSKFENLIDSMKHKDEFLKREIALLLRKQSSCLQRSAEFLKTKARIEQTLSEIEGNLAVAQEKHAAYLSEAEALEESSGDARKAYEEITEKIESLKLRLTERSSLIEHLKSLDHRDECLKKELQEEQTSLEKQSSIKEGELVNLQKKVDVHKQTIGELEAAKDLMEKQGRFEQITKAMEHELCSLEKIKNEQEKQMTQYNDRMRKIEMEHKNAVDGMMNALFTCNRDKTNCEKLAATLDQLKEHQVSCTKVLEEKKKALREVQGRFFACASMNVRLGLLSFEKLISTFFADRDTYGAITDGYYGLLIDVIDIDDRYLLPVQAVAGDLLFALVVESHVTAKAIMTAFNESRMPGTLTFLTMQQFTAPPDLPVSANKLQLSQGSFFRQSRQSSGHAHSDATSGSKEAMPAEVSSDEDNEDSPYESGADETLHYLTEALSFDNRYAKPVEDVFGKWVIVDDLVKARRIVRCVDKVQCVTIDGQKMLSRGIMSGGVVALGNVFVLLSEVKAAMTDFQKAEFELVMIKENQIRTEKKLDESQTLLDTVSAQLEEFKQSVEYYNSQKVLVAESIEVLEAELSKVVIGIRETTDAIKMRKESQEKARSTFRKLKPATVRNRLDQAEKALNAVISQVSTLNCELEYLKDKKHSLKVQLDQLNSSNSNRCAEAESKYDELTKELQEQEEKLAGMATITGVEQRICQLRSNADQLMDATIDYEANLAHVKHLRVENKSSGKRIIEELKAISQELMLLTAQASYDGEFDGIPTEELQQERDELKNNMGDVAMSDIIFCEEDEILKDLETKLQTVVQLDEEVDRFTHCLAVVKELEKDITAKQNESFVEIYGHVSAAFTRFFNALGPPGSSARLVLKKTSSQSSGSSDAGSQEVIDTIDIWADFNDGVEPESGFWHRSRGQRSVLSMSLLLAMLSFDASTLYCFDEIDSAMDERKRDVLAEFFHQLRLTGGAQMFFCTHRPEMLTHADTILLVTNDAMQSNVSEIDVETASNYVRTNAPPRAISEGLQESEEDVHSERSGDVTVSLLSPLA
ncbi:hypothetical protein QR680_016821 [Steinernema hermaphroditum]|uniref:SMC hinge domain-containing protein n=1 Tax=Steinernema hermaphroditum TaxID=289476 RepID=A0AA39LN88_9BILA|nr:hypothetical protein QR680_016821 [Steinernema hermaphroditum]